MQQSAQNLVWIDLEMTGLNAKTDRIIEIATIITNSDLDILAEGPVCAIHQSNDVLNTMDEWCKVTHGDNGLTQRVQESQTNEAVAEKITLAFIKKWVPENTSPLCGNSICQDRQFLINYMPRLSNYLHYRHLDVSSVKILAERWRPNLAKGFTKQSSHMALQDIRDSIDELRYYKQHFIITQD